MALRNSLRLTRQFSRSSAVLKDEVHPGYHKLKAIQEAFQKPDGLPVHLKGGAVDRILFGTTVVACVFGVLGFGKVVWDLGVAPKQN